MAIGGLLDAVSALLKTCRWRLRSHSRRKRKAGHRQRGAPDDGRKRVKKIVIVEEEELAVWQRTILMGRKCRPLDDAEAIHYDTYGRQIPKFRPSLPLPPQSPRLLRFKLVQVERSGWRRRLCCGRSWIDAIDLLDSAWSLQFDLQCVVLSDDLRACEEKFVSVLTLI